MEALTKILERLETSQNQLLDGMVNQENSEHLVALQLNLARGIAEIKLLATHPSKPIQLYPQNALLFDNNQPIIFIFHLTKRFAGKNRSAVYTAWNLDHMLNSAEANIIPPQGEKSAMIIGLLIIFSQLEQMKQQRATIIATNPSLLKAIIEQLDQVDDKEPSLYEKEQFRVMKKLKNEYICKCSYNFTVPLTIPQNISNTYSMIKKEADSKLSSLLS